MHSELKKILVIFLATMVIRVKGESTGNSLVNCAACQLLQPKVDHWACEVNCKTRIEQNGKRNLKLKL